MTRMNLRWENESKYIYLWTKDVHELSVSYFTQYHHFCYHKKWMWPYQIIYVSRFRIHLTGDFKIPLYVASDNFLSLGVIDVKILIANVFWASTLLINSQLYLFKCYIIHPSFDTWSADISCKSPILQCQFTQSFSSDLLCITSKDCFSKLGQGYKYKNKCTSFT